MEGSSVDAFKAASSFLVDAVALVALDEWERSGIGEWSIRELFAHVNRAYTTVEEYLFDPKPPEPPGSSYFSDAAIAARARAGLEALGDNPLSAVAAAAASAIEVVEQAADDATIGSPAGTMPLLSYLPSRTAELTIYGIDLLHALGRFEPAAPPAAVTESMLFTTRLAVARGRGETLLLAITGRGELPSGFTVY